jgi:signal transduction histidine kinase
MEKYRLSILLVEDDEDDYLIVQNLLSQIEGWAFDLDWVRTYDTALEALARRTYDVCLVDYRLNGHSGLDLLRQVSVTCKAEAEGGSSCPPMIMLTGYGNPKLDLAAMKAGAADYLIKGNIDATMLERSIRYAVERARHLRMAQEAQQHLIQSEKMISLGQLSAGIAHEIKNPLGFVMSNLGTLAEYVGVFKRLLKEYEALAGAARAGDIRGAREALERVEEARRGEDLPYVVEEVDHLLSESCEGTRRIMEIVQALKNFVRPDKSEMKKADINAGIEEALKIVGNELKYKCQVHKRLGKLPSIRCYPNRLNQVFINLLMNAVQAIPEQGEIAIQTEATDTHVVIRVSDTGHGIPEEIRGHIFEPFFTTKEAGQGTGLGLAISYGIVQAHKGTIEVRSREGEGTEFIIRIPNHLEKDAED